MRITNGTVLFPDGTLRAADLTMENGKITALPPTDGSLGDFNAQGGYVTPGLVDIHIHGALGHDTCDGAADGLEAIGRHLGAQGVTSFLATTMALSEEVLTGILSTVRQQVDLDDGGAVLRGVNLEGPFFNMGKKGAQNADFIRDPNYEMFRRLWEASGHTIRIADMAPELPGAADFIRRVSRLCTVSIAHTAADYDAAAAAFQAGASHVTHLYNAMPPFSHRAPGVIGAAAEYAGHVELISDGFHIHPSVVRSTFRWFGRDRVCLISDAMRACGMPEGQYDLGGQAVYLKEGKATLHDGTLAGSSTDLAECLRRAVSFGVPVADAFMAATANPARAAGLDGTLGLLKPGHRADVVVWDHDLRPRLILIGGKKA